MINELFDILAELARRRRHHPAGRPDGGAGAHRRRSRLRAGIGQDRARRERDGAVRAIRSSKRPISAAPRRRSSMPPARSDLASVPNRRQGATLFDIGIADGRIVDDRRQYRRRRDRRNMLDGRLVIPGFVETHIHLDKSCILDRCHCRAGNAGRRRSRRSRRPSALSPRPMSTRARSARWRRRSSRARRACAPMSKSIRASGSRAFDAVRRAQARLRLGDRPANLRLPAGRPDSTIPAPRSCWWRPASKAPI